MSPGCEKGFALLATTTGTRAKKQKVMRSSPKKACHKNGEEETKKTKKTKKKKKAKK